MLFKGDVPVAGIAMSQPS